MAKALTQVSIANLKPAASRREVADGKVAGLYLVIQPSGSASWAVRYRASGAPRKLTLGPSPALDLAAARRAAQRALAEIAEGRDPAAMKRATRVAQREQASAITNTVATVTELFVSRYAKAKNKSWAETERLLGKEVVSRWGHRPLATITRAQVHDLLDAIVDRPAPIIANRVLAAFRKLCNWSVERGIIDSSPCEKLRPPGKENRRDRILSDDEVRRVWIASISLGYPFGPIVRLLLLTGQRREEVAQMRWNEVDLKSRIWTIPKERAKNGVEHQVPLSNPAIALLSDLPRISGGMDWIFTTTGITPPSGFSRAKTNLDETITKVAETDNPSASAIAPWVLHDIRRTVASGMARLGVNLPVIEKVLNHVSGSFAGIVGVYQRHTFADEKRRALEDWGRHVDSVVNRARGV